MAAPSRVPRIAVGTELEITIKSQLERVRDNGSLTPQASSGPHYDRVGAWVVMARVDPPSVAGARPRPGYEQNLALTGLSPGSATVSLRGVVDGRWSELQFGIEVVEAWGLTYVLSTNDPQSATVYRGGETATLARGYCYEASVEILDERGVSLDYDWPSATYLASKNLREYACGLHGIMVSALGRSSLPTIGKAKAVEARGVEPTVVVEWTPIRLKDGDLDRGTPYGPKAVAVDENGHRVPLPFGHEFGLDLIVETPAACEVVSWYVVHRLSDQECRVKVTVSRGSQQSAIELTSRLP